MSNGTSSALNSEQDLASIPMAEANSLIGTPNEIIGKLETLRRCGVEYVIMNCGGSRESLRRFAREIMPAFSDEPAKVRAHPV